MRSLRRCVRLSVDLWLCSPDIQIAPAIAKSRQLPLASRAHQNVNDALDPTGFASIIPNGMPHCSYSCASAPNSTSEWSI